MSFFPGPYIRPALPLPKYPQTIPARVLVRAEDDAQPHCSLRQVQALLLGTNLGNFKDCNGTLDTFESLVNIYIQEATDLVVKFLGSPYDWCFIQQFFDGPGGPQLTLPYKNIRDVTTVYLRILPSQVWYHFGKIRRLDGTENWRIGGQEPLPTPPETFPVDVVAATESSGGAIYATGIEDADMYVDTRRGILTIPPRVLYAGLSLPMWNYSFIPGQVNVEVHYTFGFPPTKYQDGTALVFDADTGMVINPSAGPKGDGTGASPIDWSSGMPTGITTSVARLVANRVRRQGWYNLTNGLSSLSVDGASESYGGEPYGGSLDKEDEATMKGLEKYQRVMVI
jgi:hypothetical protein